MAESGREERSKRNKKKKGKKQKRKEKSCCFQFCQCTYFSPLQLSLFFHIFMGLLIHHTVALHDNPLQHMCLFRPLLGAEEGFCNNRVSINAFFGKISSYFIREQHERKWCFIKKIKIQKTFFKEVRHL